jgi:DNA polymerase I-like protein with 3'-5' exonuclease and polymerase domains
VALDTETMDLSLTAKRGAGWAYGSSGGRVVGVAVAWGDSSLYAPVAHPDTDCLDHGAVGRWVEDVVTHNTIVYQNAAYDIGWCATEWSTPVPQDFHDTILQAVMLDENWPSYSLGAIAQRLGVAGKDERMLREAAAAYDVDPKGGLWRMPARYVGPYAEQDARATLAIHGIMHEQLAREGLLAPYSLDRDLIPMVIAMRRRGIRVDLDRADMMARQYEARRDAILAMVSDRLRIGRRVTMHDMASPRFLERAFTSERVQFPRTANTGQGSFTADWMGRSSHWLPRAAAEIDQLEMMSSKFLRGFIMEFASRGRIHAEVHSHRNDDGGTRSHRFSYANPPLQQMPARTEEGRIVRTMFLPEEGDLWWAFDYSQQEPRLTVHYAALCGILGADDAVAYYQHDPDPDYHTMVSKMFGQPRKRAKIINLGMAYGMGAAKLADALDLPLDEAKVLLALYHSRVPFVGGLAKYAKAMADQRGWIRLIDGARCRFDHWERSWLEEGQRWEPPLRLEAARAKWPGRRLRRADTRKAMNRLIQGSAARQTKMAMLACWREGILPLIQMHDELGCSLGDTVTARRVMDIMETVVALRVPVKVEAKAGMTWGAARPRPWRALDRWFDGRVPAEVARSRSRVGLSATGLAATATDGAGNGPAEAAGRAA